MKANSIIRNAKLLNLKVLRIFYQKIVGEVANEMNHLDILKM